MVAICFPKGRVLHGVVGFFVFPIAIYGACRIGKPSSSLGAAPLRRAAAEEAGQGRSPLPPDRRTERFKEAFRDIVGGKPSEGLAAVGDEAAAATREAGAEVRERAERLAHAADPTRRNKDDGSDA